MSSAAAIEDKGLGLRGSPGTGAQASGVALSASANGGAVSVPVSAAGNGRGARDSGIGGLQGNKAGRTAGGIGDEAVPDAEASIAAAFGMGGGSRGYRASTHDGGGARLGGSRRGQDEDTLVFAGGGDDTIGDVLELPRGSSIDLEKQGLLAGSESDEAEDASGAHGPGALGNGGMLRADRLARAGSEVGMHDLARPKSRPELPRGALDMTPTTRGTHLQGGGRAGTGAGLDTGGAGATAGN